MVEEARCKRISALKCNSIPMTLQITMSGAVLVKYSVAGPPPSQMLCLLWAEKGGQTPWPLTVACVRFKYATALN